MTDYGVTLQGFVPKTTEVILGEIVADQQGSIDAGIEANDASPLGELNGIMAEREASLWELAQFAFDGISRDKAQGEQLDNIGAFTGTLRQAPKGSFVFCDCTLAAVNSPYAAGALVAFLENQPSVKFANANQVIVAVDGVVHDVMFVAVDDGPQLVPADTLNQISAPVTGWSAVNNPLDGTPGNLEELDPNYRVRQEEELAAAGGCNLDSLTADLLQVPGMKSVQCYENTLLLNDPVTGLTGKSFMAVVFDGIVPGADNQAIGEVVWRDKPSGMQAFGSTSVNIVDSQQQLRTVFFSRPQQLAIYLAYTVTLAKGVLITDVAPLVKAAAVDFGLANLVPGAEVFALALRAQGLVSGVIDVPSLALDFVSSPTATVNLPIGVTQIGVLDTSRITVNGI